MTQDASACVEIPTENSRVNFYRIEKYGKIRLVLNDKGRVIIIGQYKPGFLTLYKTKDNMSHLSFTTGIPRELWRHFHGELKLIAISIHETGACYYCWKDDVTLYGIEPDNNSYAYIYLDSMHWKPIDNLSKCAELLKDKPIRTWQSEQNNRTGKRILIRGEP